MRKLISFFTLISILTFLIAIFLYSNNIGNAVNFSFTLWKENLFPSLFPFFIISSLLINIGFVDFISEMFKNIFNRFLGVPKEASFVFFLSMLSGYPSNAKYLKDLLDKKQITVIEASKILNFTCFPNPLFVVNTIGIMFYNNLKIGIIILISHYIGNIITALLFKSKTHYTKSEPINLLISIKKFNKKINSTNIFYVLLNSIIESIKTLIIIFATISFFLIFLTILSSIFNLNEPYNAIISGIIEMTTGLKYISTSTLNVNYKVLVSTFFIAFGGLSIHGQILSVLKDYKILYFKFFLYRIVHSIIASIICYAIMVLQLFL